MNRTPVDFLRDIIDYGEKAVQTVASNPPEAFHRFSDCGLVLMLCLEIIGEATKNITTDIRKKYPALAWKQASGMRDILSHQYWRTDFSIILETVKTDLPPFLAGIKQVLLDFEDKT